MPDPTPPTADIAAMSFEDALAELETIVRRLETGQTRLEEGIKAYERGALLRAHCEAKLRDAQARIETIGRAADGTLTASPAAFDK
jgi:exodeoxyribonuclease VII small subunit